ncbi:DNA repair protein RadC [Puniceicoccaceae bacterium K14]|nr:DNA repair protein RadC [Puniceicoccaceae bacterium K14]
MYSSTTPKIKELSAGQRPQERLEKHGPQALNDAELLAMILRSGSKGHNVLNVASDLLKNAGSLRNLISWSPAQFKKIKSIGPVKALQLVSIVEICRRVLAGNEQEAPVLDTPNLVFNYMKSHAMGLEVEKFWTLSLNRKNRLIKFNEISSGTASNSLVHPREVFRDSIQNGASAVICIHNHPSGDPFPSSADIKVTRQLKEASKIIGIDFLDHVIIGDEQIDPTHVGFYSFQESGLI